ncbi:disease resistance protein RPP4-like [Camellia sinensis]|uniref:disease resistance protein RPP4-like n=1 Tax=Camellia sinensis TaxID=4442 RepID=UPI0010362D51|nr:disease resistance protein RPP4-like [Camellia sinensis]
MCYKRVLVVLDNVDDLDQVNALLGIRDWVQPGSKIMISTRHVQLLKADEVYKSYVVKELNDDEALRLFSWHAFGQDKPIEAYMKHSKRMIMRKIYSLIFACFFVGKDKDYIVKILEKYDFSITIGIQNLTHRGLIEVNKDNNKLLMH